MRRFKNVMVDIETLGTKSNSAIVQIAAVEFDINTGETGLEFSILLDIKDCMHQGLGVDANTLVWWMGQSKEAQEIFHNPDRVSLKKGLEMFTNYIGNSELDGIWGNSPRFDLGLLEDAYTRLGMEIPWDFRKELDLRTLVKFHPSLKGLLKFEGTPHNGIDDCKYQIRYCSAIWTSIRDALNES